MVIKMFANTEGVYTQENTHKQEWANNIRILKEWGSKKASQLILFKGEK
jgi:hypothetical protein|tara:strand:- start:1150 stop:1296 length:147 start_codon:yes stop_codon:yes gene_type:complete